MHFLFQYFIRCWFWVEYAILHRFTHTRSAALRSPASIDFSSSSSNSCLLVLALVQPRTGRLLHSGQTHQCSTRLGDSCFLHMRFTATVMWFELTKSGFIIYCPFWALIKGPKHPSMIFFNAALARYTQSPDYCCQSFKTKMTFKENVMRNRAALALAFRLVDASHCRANSSGTAIHQRSTTADKWTD